MAWSTLSITIAALLFAVCVVLTLQVDPLGLGFSLEGFGLEGFRSDAAFLSRYPSTTERRLGAGDLSEIQVSGPILVFVTASIVTICGVAARNLEGAEGLALHLAKLVFLDSIDQLISIFLMLWTFNVETGDGPKALAVLAVMIGCPAFFSHSATLHMYISGDSAPYKFSNAVGLLADLCSVSAMAVIEFTAKERDDMPGWLKGMDWLWSVLSIMAEMYAILTAVGPSGKEST